MMIVLMLKYATKEVVKMPVDFKPVGPMLSVLRASTWQNVHAFQIPLEIPLLHVSHVSS
jgi:hypothetical protein